MPASLFCRRIISMMMMMKGVKLIIKQWLNLSLIFLNIDLRYISFSTNVLNVDHIKYFTTKQNVQ